VKVSPEDYLKQYRESGRSVIGTFICGGKNKSGEDMTFIIPDDDRLPKSFDVRTVSDRGQAVIPTAIMGTRVVAHFIDRTNFVDVVEILQKQGKVDVDVLGILRSHNLYEEFPSDVVAEAKTVGKPVNFTAENRGNRVDLRGKTLVTIDPEDAKDLDDAVGLEINPDGTYELGVHIADVSHYVREGSLLDGEAFNRGTSVYFPGGVLPMLPVQLSNVVCSLNPHEDRFCLSCLMTVDKSGNVLKSKIVETVININTRFSYNTVQGILDGDTELCKAFKPLVPMLQNMAELTKILEGVRHKRGEVAFNIPEPKIVLDENGKIASVVAYPHLLAHRVIETFMVLCNETIAGYALEHDLPFIYRIHEKPDPMKVAKFNDMLKPFGIPQTINVDKPSGFDYQKLLRAAHEKGGKDGEVLEHIISKLALRSMQKAKYSEQIQGHFGLGSKHYSHFTSPIRRYPDLAIHRILKDAINRRLSSHKIEEYRDFVRRAADRSTKTEIIATDVEREVDQLKCAQYMHDHIGEDFTGTISGIADFGIFVELENTVEGLVRIENLPHMNDGNSKREFWDFNEKQFILTSNRGRTLRMGDQITVTAIGVNMARRQIEFKAK
jgi:ribonuclease R